MSDFAPQREQRLARPVDEVFAFFADPLSEIQLRQEADFHMFLGYFF